MPAPGEHGCAPILHVGYHKTGTTWLQSGLFNERYGVFGQVEEKGRVTELFAPSNPFSFDAAGVQEALHARTRAVAEQGLYPVLSCERLSGSPHAGGFDSRTIADRLAMVFPGSRVLIVIREQRRIIVSTYKQYVRAGGTASIQRYLDPPQRGRGRVPLFRLGYYEYDWLLSYYRDRFGAASVLVLPQEWLERDHTEFCRRITEFAGLQPAPELPPVRRNPALAGFTVAVRRRTNRWIGRDAINPTAARSRPDLSRGIDRFVDRWAPGALHRAVDRKIEAAVSRAVGSHYERSNCLTASMTGLPLEELGYGCGSAQASASAREARGAPPEQDGSRPVAPIAPHF